MSTAIAFSNPQGFREVYQAHHGFVWHALHRFGLSGAALEDALQDVFVVAYRRADDLAGSPKAWLYAIARRVASNYRRTTRRRDARADALAQSLSGPRRALPEAIVALDRYLENLAPEDRELFYLSEVEGLTGPEIAAASGRNLNTVYSRIRKLRTTLHDEALPDRARGQQPRASASAWAALLPSLEPAVAAIGWVSAWWIAGVGLAAAALVRVAVQPAQAPGPPVVAAHEDAAPAAVVSPPSITPHPSRPAVAPERPSPAEASAPRGPRTSAAATKAPSTLTEENTLLTAARDALARGDAEAAMRHANEHAQRFPGSVLADVRAVVRIEALCAQGKAPQARAEAKILLNGRPSSTARRRLEKSCAGPSQNPDEPDMSGA